MPSRPSRTRLTSAACCFSGKLHTAGELYGSHRLLALLDSDVDGVSLLGRHILDDVKSFVFKSERAFDPANLEAFRLLAASKGKLGQG